MKKKKQTIEELEKALKKKPERDYKSETEKARTSVTRTINNALKKISSDNTIASIKRYLSKSTIKTGDTLRYVPDVNDNPSWILDPESNNQ